MFRITDGYRDNDGTLARDGGGDDDDDDDDDNNNNNNKDNDPDGTIGSGLARLQ